MIDIVNCKLQMVKAGLRIGSLGAPLVDWGGEATYPLTWFTVGSVRYRSYYCVHKTKIHGIENAPFAVIDGPVPPLE